MVFTKEKTNGQLNLANNLEAIAAAMTSILFPGDVGYMLLLGRIQSDQKALIEG